MQRDAIMRVSLLTAKFQSTRSHGTVRLPSFSTPRASIHAPHGVRRASGCQSALGAFQSTHPVWGATILQSYMCHNTILFQSTHPHGAPHCAKSRIYKLACPLAPAQGLSARAPCGWNVIITIPVRATRGYGVECLLVPRKISTPINTSPFGCDGLENDTGKPDRDFIPLIPCRKAASLLVCGV